ncbi:unnamed protein product [Amoebophrya sp. A25]|nr:unnamed protein product [Amoebophrya sp. A25]|eukprot:GSA25T00020218001.1
MALSLRQLPSCLRLRARLTRGLSSQASSALPRSPLGDAGIGGSATSSSVNRSSMSEQGVAGGGVALYELLSRTPSHIMRPLSAVVNRPTSALALDVYDDLLRRRGNQQDWSSLTLEQRQDLDTWRDATGEPLAQNEARAQQIAAVEATIPTAAQVRHDVRRVLQQGLHVLRVNRDILRSDGGHAKMMDSAAILPFVLVLTAFAFLALGCLAHPLEFECQMHLMWEALSLTWWAAVYAGLDFAKAPGTLTAGSTSGPPVALAASFTRTKLGALMFSFAAVAVLLTEEQLQRRDFPGPWISYYVLIAGHLLALKIDRYAIKNLLVPSWIGKWKWAVNVAAATSLALACMMGQQRLQAMQEIKLRPDADNWTESNMGSYKSSTPLFQQAQY